MDGCVNVSVANMYADATYRSEVISQAILGEVLKIQDSDSDFSLVRTPDGYSGWISNYQWVKIKSGLKNPVVIRAHFATVLDKPADDGLRIRDVVLGARLEKTDQKADWISVRLPDGISGWVKESQLAGLTNRSPKNIAKIAQEFLGYPYFWGGKSPKGFDCSGLTQTVFNLADIRLPRDSWMQHRDTRMVSDDPEQARAGDLYFFAENGNKITHVGIALGKMKILHSRGYVRINSLIKSDSDFDENLLKTFVDSRTCFE